MTTDSLLDTLLFETEGTELDFKRDQYPFERASDEQKAELLKDILAFANAWRRSDAYVLIGVEEVTGGPSRVVGVSEHLDDAKLQQFVNAKTNRPIELAYRAVAYRGTQVGLIRVPVQQRPVYLTRDYSSLRRDTVYIRRGSSTDIARPDEIAKMGTWDPGFASEPKLEALLLTGDDWTVESKDVRVETVNITSPRIADLPDYRPDRPAGPFGLTLAPGLLRANSDFFRERAEYVCFDAKLRAVRLAVRNTGTALASGVKLVLRAEDPAGEVEVKLGSDRPQEPEKEWNPIVNVGRLRGDPLPDIELRRQNNGWVVTAHLSKVLAKDMVYSDERLYIGRATTGDVAVTVEVFADQLAAPVLDAFTWRFAVEQRALTIESFTRL